MFTFLMSLLFNSLVQAGNTITLGLRPDQVMVTGNTTAGNWMYLTAKEYEQKLNQKEFTPFDFIVVEDLPPNLEPFPFAGVITNAIIPPASHIERQADIARFPLISLPNAPEKFKFFKRLAQINLNQGMHKVQIDKNHDIIILPNISVDEALSIIRSRIVPWKPAALNHNAQIQNLEKIWVKSTTLESFGQKLEGLRIAQGDGSELSRHFPDVVGISEDYIDNLLKRTQIANEGITVNEKILSLLDQIQGDSFGEATKTLNQIQQIIANAPFNFDNIIKAVTTHLDLNHHPQQGIRIRSSSRVESMLGAGVLDSIFLPADQNATYEIRMTQINQGIRKVMQSVFHPRAYFLRQLFQIPQDQMGVGLGIHQSTDHLQSSGVMQFWHFNGHLRAKIIAYPSNTGGTSPEYFNFETLIVEYRTVNGLHFFESEFSTQHIPTPSTQWLKTTEMVSLLSLAEKSFENWNKVKPSTDRLLAEWGITHATANEPSSTMFFDIKNSPIQTQPNLQIKESISNKSHSRLPKDIIDFFARSDIHPISKYKFASDIPRGSKGFSSFFIFEFDQVPELFLLPAGATHYLAMNLLNHFTAPDYAGRYSFYAFGSIILFQDQIGLIESVDFLFSNHSDPTDSEFLKIYEIILKSGYEFAPDALIEGFDNDKLFRTVLPEHGIEIIDEVYVRAKDLFNFLKIPTTGTTSLSAANCQDLLSH